LHRNPKGSDVNGVQPEELGARVSMSGWITHYYGVSANLLALYPLPHGIE
jgi:hypothetical protein